MVLALVLIPVALWPMTHQYHGLAGDEELYAVQAFSRLQPNLANDLFLRGSLQDRYTIFSPIFAELIRLIGLGNAAVALLVALKAWYYAAGFILVRRFATPLTALFAVSLLIVTNGAYGGFGAFHFSEDMLTARTLAEALSMTALALYFHDRKVLGLAVSAAALFVHALIALPAVLLIGCLLLPWRWTLTVTAAGVALALGVAATSLLPPSAPHPFTVIDPEWLEIVRERSQFLFLDLWRWDDWQVNLRAFVSLGLSALVLSEPPLRKLCLAATLVGAAGLVIAFVAGTVGPVAILLQGQSWRWMWLTAMIALLLIAPTVSRLWQADPCGPPCALLLMIGWLFFRDDAAPCVALAAAVWLGRTRVTPRLVPVVRTLTVLIAIVIGALIVANAATLWCGTPAEIGRESPSWHLAREIARLDGCAIVFAWLLGYVLLTRGSVWLRMFLALGLAGVVAGAVPGSFNAMSSEGTQAQIQEFADWRAAIPPTSNVFLAPARNSARLAWFSLQRPSYLTVDQSSGVVFSRPTALEVKRRSDVLRPLMDPDWKLLSNSRGEKVPPVVLTAQSLVRICRDPELNFVVARENVGFEPLIHRHRGPWHDWALYDCRRVNALAGAE